MPPTIVRPSGKTVSTYSSTVSRNKNELRRTLPVPFKRAAISSSDAVVPAAALSCTELRPHRTAEVSPLAVQPDILVVLAYAAVAAVA